MISRVEQALESFARSARQHYGERLRGIYLFGSRARGDFEEESDADVVVVLRDGDWRFWDEKKKVISLAFETVLATGLYVQAWPVAESAWSNPDPTLGPSFLESARRDAKPIQEAA
jgi:predicted nucleotidyltransferase